MRRPLSPDFFPPESLQSVTRRTASTRPPLDDSLSNVEQTPDNSTLAPDVASASILTDFMPPTVTVAPLEASVISFVPSKLSTLIFDPLLASASRLTASTFNTDRSAALDTSPENLAQSTLFTSALEPLDNSKSIFELPILLKYADAAEERLTSKSLAREISLFAVNVAPDDISTSSSSGEDTVTIDVEQRIAREKIDAADVDSWPVDILVMLFITRTQFAVFHKNFKIRLSR